jgi:tryptophan synthase alpha subunit
MTTRLADKFAACARENRPALGIFTMAGDPDFDTGVALL